MATGNEFIRYEIFYKFIRMIENFNSFSFFLYAVKNVLFSAYKPIK